MPKLRKPVSDAEAIDREIRETCKVLESVARSYPRGSAERGAIKEAADAFIYLRLHQALKQSYEAFQRSCAKPLTKAQRQVLRRMGVAL